MTEQGLISIKFSDEAFIPSYMMDEFNWASESKIDRLLKEDEIYGILQERILLNDYGDYGDLDDWDDL